MPPLNLTLKKNKIPWDIWENMKRTNLFKKKISGEISETRVMKSLTTFLHWGGGTNSEQKLPMETSLEEQKVHNVGIWYGRRVRGEVNKQKTKHRIREGR